MYARPFLPLILTMGYLCKSFLLNLHAANILLEMTVPSIPGIYCSLGRDATPESRGCGEVSPQRVLLA